MQILYLFAISPLNSLQGKAHYLNYQIIVTIVWDYYY